MKYYIVAGEASGDLHASNLLKAIKAKDPEAEFRGWGGEMMEAQGTTLVKHYRDLAFMGFIEVVANLRTIAKNLKFCKADIADWKPDAVILVDYPGFNLRIAPFAKELGIRVHYYISPQVWAWKQNRVHKIKKVVDRMFVILPFEKPFYARFDIEVDFVGHPLLDALYDLPEMLPFEAFANQHGLDPSKPLIAVLPGSRRQEIKVKLPLMLSVMQDFPDHQFAVGMAPSIDESWYKELLKGLPVGLIKDDTYGLMRQASAGMVTSGTATLEAALLGLPEVVCYKGSAISYHIAKRLIKIDYISLVNLIMDREVVKELIQHELNHENLRTELKGLLEPGARLDTLKSDYSGLRDRLGGEGASDRCAEMMLADLKTSMA